MSKIKSINTIVILLVTVFLLSCSNQNNKKENTKNQTEETEVKEIALSEKCDITRNGAQLTLAYDSESNSFKGTIYNTTDKNIQSARVAIRLSNGTILGPISPVELTPKETFSLTFTATTKDFKRWAAYFDVIE